MEQVLAAERLSDSPALVLLRADSRSAAVGLLAEHLGGEIRRMAAPTLFERIEEGLVELRDHGFDLPRTAQAYCSDWVGAGILIRRAGDGREETLELSDGALAAIRFVTGLADEHRTVTESRLVTIVERLRALAVATDPDVATRTAALRAERDRIDAEIERIELGEVDVLDRGRAVEQLLDVLALAAALPTDFARVRSELDRINGDLRRRLVEDAEDRGAVLDEVFRGVDHVAESDAGRSFEAFYALMLDAELGARFDGAVAALLDREFASGLGPARRSLRRLLPSLQDASAEVHDVMTSFSRSLRRFVQSRALGEERQLHRLLQAAQRDALEVARRVPPFRRLDLDLPLSAVPLASVGTLTLHDPADARSGELVVAGPTVEVDVASLRTLARESEIDLRELESAVDDVLDRLGAATIGEVLRQHPASQGVASVVGLLVLAEEQATALADGEELVGWTSLSGVERHGRVPRYLFQRPAQTSTAQEDPA